MPVPTGAFDIDVPILGWRLVPVDAVGKCVISTSPEFCAPAPVKSFTGMPFARNLSPDSGAVSSIRMVALGGTDAVAVRIGAWKDACATPLSETVTLSAAFTCR